MVIESHSVQVGEDVFVLMPPFKEVFILHIFDISVEVV
jgi:hypothetical protein